MKKKTFPYFIINKALDFFSDISNPILKVCIDSALKKCILEFEKNLFLRCINKKFTINVVR